MLPNVIHVAVFSNKSLLQRIFLCSLNCSLSSLYHISFSGTYVTKTNNRKAACPRIEHVLHCASSAQTNEGLHSNITPHKTTMVRVTQGRKKLAPPPRPPTHSNPRRDLHIFLMHMKACKTRITSRGHPT